MIDDIQQIFFLVQELKFGVVITWCHLETCQPGLGGARFV